MTERAGNDREREFASARHRRAFGTHCHDGAGPVRHRKGQRLSRLVYPSAASIRIARRERKIIPLLSWPGVSRTRARAVVQPPRRPHWPGAGGRDTPGHDGESMSGTGSDSLTPMEHRLMPMERGLMPRERGTATHSFRGAVVNDGATRCRHG